jgi:hypothetical protein
MKKKKKKKKEGILLEIHNRNLFKGIQSFLYFYFSFFFFFLMTKCMMYQAQVYADVNEFLLQFKFLNSITKITVVCLPRVLPIQQTSRSI